MHIQKHIKLALVTLRVNFSIQTIKKHDQNQKIQVFIDIFSSDEVISDAYKFVQHQNNAVVEYKSQFIKKTTASEEGDTEVDLVIDVIDQFDYNIVLFDKTSYKSYVKNYINKVKMHLESNHPNRVQGFVADANSMVTWILENFNQFQFYYPKSFDPQGIVILSYYKDGDDTPTFLYFIDGLKVIGD